ncbi:MAG: hypothetical protein QOG72_1252 [Sphingomonadales bacterium]|jgi:hypothetical protein|nr:hypothetical protein [Sphingomonadales bacterium]
MRKRPPVRLFRLSRPARNLAAAGLGLALAAAPAPAAPSDPVDQSITVDGTRLPERAARDMAVNFVRATGVAAGETPAARWVAAICPEVLGLEDIGRRAAEAKIRKVASAAGAAVAPEGCHRNIVVSFTSDGAALAREIVEREPGRVANLSSRARSAVLTGSAPIRWLYTAETVGRHGGGETTAGNAAQSGPATHAGSGAGSSIGGDLPSLMHYESSVLSTLTNRILTSAIVIIDTDEAMGRRLDTLAAYAALVALAEIRNADAAPPGSILTLFESAAPPRDLTVQDRAFLRALYRLPLDRQAMQHRGQLVHGIIGDLTGQN